MDKAEFKTILDKDIEIIEKAIIERLPVCTDEIQPYKRRKKIKTGFLS